jgi:hypothetical protein
MYFNRKIISMLMRAEGPNSLALLKPVLAKTSPLVPIAGVYAVIVAVAAFKTVERLDRVLEDKMEEIRLVLVSGGPY